MDSRSVLLTTMVLLSLVASLRGEHHRVKLSIVSVVLWFVSLLIAVSIFFWGC